MYKEKLDELSDQREIYVNGVNKLDECNALVNVME
jgi:hypothetical protein